MWIEFSKQLPPEGELVDTMIEENGERRNQQQLRRRGKLMFIPNGAMYVYYTPTHWWKEPDLLIHFQNQQKTTI